MKKWKRRTVNRGIGSGLQIRASDQVKQASAGDGQANETRRVKDWPAGGEIIF